MDAAVLVSPSLSVGLLGPGCSRGAAALEEWGKADDLFALPEELGMRGELIKSTVSFSLGLCVWHY